MEDSIVLILIISFFIILTVCIIMHDVSKKRHYKMIVQETKEANNKIVREIFDKYGKPTVILDAVCKDNRNMDWRSDINSHIIVYEQTKIFFLKGKKYDLSELTGYSISVNNQIVSASTNISTGSMLGRAVVGGVLLGGVGAILGANSADTETNYTAVDNAIVSIFTNSISNPAISLDLICPDPKELARIEGVLRIITAKTE